MGRIWSWHLKKSTGDSTRVHQKPANKPTTHVCWRVNMSREFCQSKRDVRGYRSYRTVTKWDFPQPNAKNKAALSAAIPARGLWAPGAMRGVGIIEQSTPIQSSDAFGVKNITEGGPHCGVCGGIRLHTYFHRVKGMAGRNSTGPAERATWC